MAWRWTSLSFDGCPATFGQQTVRAPLVEVQHPISDDLKPDTAVPGIDSISGGNDAEALFRGLGARVIEEIVTGASRREAADHYGISASVVVIWAQRWEKTGSVAAKPSGGSTSPLEDHAEFLLALAAEQPDLTLDEVVAVMNKRGIAGSRSAVWRFFDRHDLTFKKNFVRGGAKARRCGPRAPALDARARHV